ncbi:RNA polymerase sigma-70 factor [Nocardia sp. SYP-A9097]|uniref:RNA polymerase sigma-70 factor n=1 Tax=Nocardia sp. SYP-A9097 TaxID=2663237 RepID=UPI00129AF11C|nr:RNA polymerase sigma-70 factor [Nocardia sp. SYP-A9097]MRH92157.1 RNA polymerase sigma-70 factor [Nocardia sp. SYP-A9097]
MSTPSDSELGKAIGEFSRLRGRVFGIAYRMLGTVADAEDIVQDVWVKWQSYEDRGSVRDSTAFLVTMTTRLSINATQTARVRRETYVGPWLPEPVDTSADPSLGAERAAALETAVLVVLEKMTPTERAAFVLREAFDYPYDAIAEILQMKEPAARKLVSRARPAIESDRQTPVDTADQRRLLSAFLVAARAGDFDALETLFATDVASYADGGGKVRNVSRIPVLGRDRVAKYVAAFASHFWIGVTLDWVDANGRPSVLIRRDGAPIAWLAVGLADDENINRIYWVFNPAKLVRVAQVVAAQGDSTTQ